MGCGGSAWGPGSGPGSGSGIIGIGVGIWVYDGFGAFSVVGLLDSGV